MKIVKFLGGLGNQMFQYAFLEALKARHGEDILADTTNYDLRAMHNGFALDSVFGLHFSFASRKQTARLSWYCGNYYVRRALNLFATKPTTCIERHFYRSYPQYLERQGDIYYDGYWQNHAYFDDIHDRLASCFRFRQETEGRNRQFAGALSDGHTHVSLHIRRGDYDKRIYRGLCGIVYYRQAISETLRQHANTSWHVFSNDMAWCREHVTPLLQGQPLEFVDWNTGADSWRDMQLMSLCPVNIIANSSFSWWAAWLNRQPGKHVIAPRKWVNYPMEYQIQMPAWQLI